MLKILEEGVKTRMVGYGEEPWTADVAMDTLMLDICNAKLPAEYGNFFHVNRHYNILAERYEYRIIAVPFINV